MPDLLRYASATVLGLSVLGIALPGFPATDLTVASGKSQVLKPGGALVRVALSDPKVMDVKVVGQDQLLVQGLKPGDSSLWVWTRDGKAHQYDVHVGLDVGAVQRQLTELTGNDKLRVAFNGQAFILSGAADSVTQREVAEKIVGAAGRPVINLATTTQRRDQIAIDVYVVELSKTASLNLGISYGGGEVTDLTNGIRKFVFKPGEVMTGEATTGQLNTFGTLDFLAAKLQALQNRGEAKLLARPTLVTTDGGTAHFLAGGEIPIPIQQALGQTTIMWKEFGVRLEVQPTLLGDGRVSLAVKPEVSSLDFANGLKQGSFTVPALRTRRADTQVVLGTSETLMLGGLMNAEQNRGYDMLPGLGDVPILGELFKSRSFQDNQSELAIMVTPRLLGPTATRELPGRLPAVGQELEGTK
jgi:pilus assembly protein CpaC